MAANNTHLDDLPPELRIKLLELLPDISTLSKLVHASPAYHSTYTVNREAILTKVTLQDLEDRDIDLFEPTSFMEVSVRKDKFSHLLKPAIVAAREQHQTGKRIKLEVYQCIVLRTIILCINWNVNPTSPPTAYSNSNRISNWVTAALLPGSYMGGWRSNLKPSKKLPPLHILSFGPYSAREVRGMIVRANGTIGGKIREVCGLRSVPLVAPTVSTRLRGGAVGFRRG